jgi:hypothetical protein
MWSKLMRATGLAVKPEPGEVAEAAENPGGWVYRISGFYGPDDRVPPEAIVGACKVGENGMIIGDFLPNLNFRSDKRGVKKELEIQTPAPLRPRAAPAS